MRFCFMTNRWQWQKALANQRRYSDLLACWCVDDRRIAFVKEDQSVNPAFQSVNLFCLRCGGEVN